MAWLRGYQQLALSVVTHPGTAGSRSLQCAAAVGTRVQVQVKWQGWRWCTARYWQAATRVHAPMPPSVALDVELPLLRPAALAWTLLP